MNTHQYQLKEENNFPKAIGISTVIFGLLIVLGLFIVFGSDIPQYGMGGVIVNYGTSEEGMGDDYMSVQEPSMDENANMVVPDKIDPESTPEPTPSQQTSDKAVATQDMDDAPAVNQPDKPVEKAAPESTTKKEESQPTANPNALYKGKKNNSTGRGDGTGNTPGNQGSDLGDPLASNYGEGGSGFGDMMLDLKDRRWTSPPRVEDRGQEAGRVVVQFRVNRQGVVTWAKAGMRGTTISDGSLWAKCERALMNARFNPIQNAPESQTGQVVFNFGLR